MSRREVSRETRKMRDDWDRRARENARYYVATDREDWDEEEFYRSGEINLTDFVRNDLGNVCQGRDPKEMTVIEIGCGAGRITRALAGFFGRVYAVDISREMVRQARRALESFPNARVLQNNGRDLSVIRNRWWQRFGQGRTVQADFVFSYIVFQHIPSREIIENYVREAARLLRSGGLFKFQVQGASFDEQGTGSWMGVTFSEQEARDMAERCGFEMRHHRHAGEQYYWLWFFKKGGLRWNEYMEYLRVGQLDLEDNILCDLENVCRGMDPKKMRVLEIGAGDGRTTRALAGYFGQVCRVELGDAMLPAPPGVSVLRGKDLSVLRGSWWKRIVGGTRPEFDFAYSQNAFDPLPDRARMERDLRDVERVLRPGALLKLRAGQLAEDEAVKIAERCGLVLRHCARMNERQSWLWLVKEPRAAAPESQNKDEQRIAELIVAHQVRTDLGNICQGRDPKQMRVLEVSRGKGSVARALANVFGEARVLDVDSRARWWKRRERMDFAFAPSVFLEISSGKEIERTMREAGSWLRAGALFKCRMRRFDPEDAGAMAARCGFELRYRHTAGEQDYWLWLFKETA